MPQTHHLQPTRYHFTFGPAEPALRVQNGDTVIAPTRDSRGFDADGQPLAREAIANQGDEGYDYWPRNPLVGPVYVEGAEPGDILAVHIERVELTRDWGFSARNVNFGSLTGEYVGHRLLLNPPLEAARLDWQIDRQRMKGVYPMPNSRLSRAEIDLHPFIGSIGVAPRFGRVETALAPGEFGGNMDCPETCAGTTLLFPVWTRGAYLYFGDVHAAQGDGELCGTAIEMAAEVQLRLEIRPGPCGDWPRAEDATHLMAIGSTRPLMDSVRLAQVELMNWLVRDYGFDFWEVWQLNSQVGTMRIGNVVDPYYSVVAKFPKRFLPG